MNPREQKTVPAWCFLVLLLAFVMMTCNWVVVTVRLNSMENRMVENAEDEIDFYKKMLDNMRGNDQGDK